MQQQQQQQQIAAATTTSTPATPVTAAATPTPAATTEGETGNNNLQSTPTNNNANGSNETNENELTDALHMNFSSSTHPFGLPGLVEVAYAAKQHFQDPGMRIDSQKFRGELTYRFEFSKKVAKTGHALNFKHLGNDITVPLYAMEPQHTKNTSSSHNNKNRNGKFHEDGLLLNFKYAARNIFCNIPNSYFDNEVTNSLHLELLKPTELQPIKGTDTFSYHRYCVVRRPENLAVIPESIPVVDSVTGRRLTVKVTYFGQERYCARCLDKHVGRCPELAEFYEAQEIKKQMVKEKAVKSIIYGDSTLALTDSLGLRSDVVAMSGGGLGQVAQAVIDNPKTKDADNILIVGGANDLKNHALSQPEEFAENVCGTLAKICDIAMEHPEKKVVVVNSYPSTENPEEEMMFKEAILHKAVEELTDGTKEGVPGNVSHVNVAYETDETGHPTLQGTVDLLMQISEQLKIAEPLVWNTKFIATEKRYAHVQSVYRYGCTICRNYGLKITREQHHNSMLCDACLENVKKEATTKSYSFLEKAKLYVEEKLKEMEELDKDADMSTESEGDDNQSNADGTDGNDDGTTRKKVKIGTE